MDLPALSCAATAAFGLEGLVKRELGALGFSSARAENGSVRFEAGLRELFRACLWLSCADRALIVMAEGRAESFEALFQLVKAAPWAALLPRDARIPVSGHCARSRLMSARDCQAITKKAIVDSLMAAHRTRALPETGARFQVDVSLHGDIARITLDASGEALNKRGYRTWNGEAPLRETAAAALCRMALWKGGAPLHDPFCGTGTLLVEAAFLRARRAPGLTRAFDMESWPVCASLDLQGVRREAAAAFDPALLPEISGSDIDPGALELARRHIKQAGLEGKIHVFQRDVQDLQLPGAPCFLCNPPYGERLGDRAGCEKLYRAFKPLLVRHPGATLNLITSHPGFERVAGLRAVKKNRLYNGRLECEFMRFAPVIGQPPA